MNINFETISSNIEAKLYPLLGSGSGRKVFDLKDDMVVKVARNRKGIEQNKAEDQISASNHARIFAKVLGHSEDYNLLIMEKAQHINSFTDIWRYYQVKNNRQLLSLQEFHQVMEEYQLLPADLYRLSSWGIVQGRPVIIDYGFTKQVREFYRFRI